MKQALSSEGPARVRRGHLRTFTLGLGASALAMACSFGEIDNDDGAIDPVAPGNAGSPDQEGTTPDDVAGNTQGTGVTPSPSNDDPSDAEEAYDPNDYFAGPLGTEAKGILTKYCGDCHVGNIGASGDFGYLLDVNKLVTGEKIVPGAKEDSYLYNRMVGGSMPPAAYRAANGIPSYSQIATVGQWIDELQIEDPRACEPLEFIDVDTQISLMAQDISRLDPVTEAPFTRYMTINYSSNAGDCARGVERQRFALFKGINSVSTNPVISQPVAIAGSDETIYRIDIRKYNWDRAIDLEDDGVVDFQDAWEAIVGSDQNDTASFVLEYQGDAADDLKADSKTLKPFMPVNVFIQATEFGDLYYALIGGKANLFDFESQVLKIDKEAEIEANRLMRAGFSNSGVSQQERVLNRFDSGIAGGLNYWISFDFDGGGGGEVADNFNINQGNESIFSNPIDFVFAGGEAIFSLPNGLQAYYVANAAGKRLATAPIGVVVDPSQNNGLVTNGASCGSCHNAGMIPFTDQVRAFVEENREEFDNETYEAVVEQYVDAKTFQDVMNRDSKVHVDATERAGVPAKEPDAISRVYLDFQLLSVEPNMAAAEFGVPLDRLEANIDLLDPRLSPLASGGHVDRDIMAATYLDAVCKLQNVQDNTPVGCP